MLEAVNKLEGKDFIANGSTLTPILNELIKVSKKYLRMIAAADEK